MQETERVPVGSSVATVIRVTIRAAPGPRNRNINRDRYNSIPGSDTHIMVRRSLACMPRAAFSAHNKTLQFNTIVVELNRPLHSAMLATLFRRSVGCYLVI